MKFRSFVQIAVALVMSGAALSAQAFSLDWSGAYRVEYFGLDDPRLSDGPAKSYVLNHLELRPTVIASDNVKITSEFQVLPNEAYPDSQLGQFMGAELNGSGSNVLSQTQGSSQIRTTQLYMTWEQEYGALLVGRAPVDFGLGMTFNGGFSPYDHWQDVRDIVGYKFTLGNFFILPMLGRVVDQGPGTGSAARDQMLHLEYENPESGSLFAIFYEGRTAGQGINDAYPRIPGSAANAGEFSSSRVNIAIGREFEALNMTVEGGFYTGDTGATTAGGQNISIDAFGLASEINYRPEGSRFTSGLLLGYASGDDPSTEDTYESYLFDRNYDVALLMMNHPLGANRDFLRTSADRGAGDAEDVVDVESISNVIYVAPYLTWAWTETLNVRNRFIYAHLNTDPNPSQGVDQSLGFEWDIELLYKPQERVEWITQVGLLFPGETFKGGAENLDTNFTFGIGTKAVISF